MVESSSQQIWYYLVLLNKESVAQTGDDAREAFSVMYFTGKS
jgi:hypothetical protein